MPIVNIQAPPGVSLDAKKEMVKSINEALEKVYPLSENLIFLQEYPLENVALNGGLQSENSELAEAFRKIQDNP